MRANVEVYLNFYGANVVKDSLQKIRRSWFCDGIEPAGDLMGELKPHIHKSWSRCLRLGVNPSQKEVLGNIIDGNFLLSRMEQRSQLIGLAAPMMSYFHGLVRGVQGVVVLADHQGVIIHSIGDADFMSKAEGVLLKPGASWMERHRGTNAIGTALEEQGPVDVNGYEHFMLPHSFLSCSAAPIFDSSGKILGVINISTDSRNYHPYISGLVAVAAHSLERQLFLNHTVSQVVTVRIHPHVGGLGSISEGVLGLAEDGEIVGANSVALEYLGISRKEIGIEKFQQVVDIRLGEIFMIAKKHSVERRLLKTYRGKNLVVEFELVGGPSKMSSRLDFQAVTMDAPAQCDCDDSHRDLKTISRGAALGVLEVTGGNVTKAARVLGISRNTLYKYMRQTYPNGQT